MARRLIFAALMALAAGVTANAQTPLLPGDLVVLQAANNTSNNTTASLLELSSLVIGQVTPIQTINTNTITDGSGNNFRISGSATSTGYLKTNPNGSITFTGVLTPNTNTTVNSNTITTRGVGVLSANGSLSLGATYTGASGNQPRSAVTDNGTNFFIVDQGGIYREGATTAALTGNYRGGQIVNGQTYISQASTTAIAISAVTPAVPSTAGAVTATALPGISAISTLQDTVLLSSGFNGTNVVDTIYVATTTGITKYGLSGGSFVSEGTTTVTGSLFGITARANGTGGIDIFATTGGGATAANSVIRITDGTLDPTQLASFGTASTLFTTGAGTTLKGITFAPTAVPEPTTVLGLGAAAFGLMRAVRRRK